nr:MAG TPA: hypothetical protein [Caudoviricetes sp.]
MNKSGYKVFPKKPMGTAVIKDRDIFLSPRISTPCTLKNVCPHPATRQEDSKQAISKRANP